MERFEQKKSLGRSDALLSVIKWPRIPAQHLEKTHWCATYEEPLLIAISAIKHGKSVPHEDTPADNFRDGEVLSSEDGRELGIVEETEKGTSVLAKDLSIFPEGRVWYRTGIQIDDLTWSALWGVAESREKTKKQKRKRKKNPASTFRRKCLEKLEK